jgi:ubiquinone/menaquinone biosynthesis C-methylase UbiE
LQIGQAGEHGLSKAFIFPYNQAAMEENQYHDPAEQNHRQARQEHWDVIARKRDSWRGMGVWYHRRIREIYRFLISPGQRVLEIGSGTGDLLTHVRPATGVGIDFSAEQVRRARERYPQIEFTQADAHMICPSSRVSSTSSSCPT